MTLCRQVVDLVGLDIQDQVVQAVAIGEVPVVQNQLVTIFMVVAVEMIDPLRIKRARPPDQSVDFVVLLQKQLGKVGAILARDAGHKRCS